MLFVHREQLHSALRQQLVDPTDGLLSQEGQPLGKYPKQRCHVTKQRLSLSARML